MQFGGAAGSAEKLLWDCTLRAHEEKGRETDARAEKTEGLLIFKAHLSTRE